MNFRTPELFHRLSNLRYRLLTLVLVPLLLLTGTVILLAARWSTDYTYQQLFTKVNTDLRVARDGFSRIQHDQQLALESLANSLALRDPLSKNSTEELLAILAARSSQGEFDFLNLLSGDASQRLSADGWQPRELHQSPLTRQILSFGSAQAGTLNATGIEVYAPERWQAEPTINKAKVVFPLIDTPRAAPTTRNAEDRAMVIRSLQAVVDEQGVPIAILEGGLLLNRNFAFVDQIRDLVYGPGSLAPGSRGTVTVFLDDVRITTNVPANDDSRALGTRVSREVRDTVLTEGKHWIDRAFVVNDWYISAYEPIIDVHGERVGILYAGYLEAPFRSDLQRAIALVSALVLAGSLLSVIAAIVGARSIFQPIESLTAVVRATAAGQHRRVGLIRSGGEIGELAAQFDAMLDTLEQHRLKIEEDSLLLEEKVQSRTAEIRQQNRLLTDSIQMLQHTRQQLATAEKLAALGELTAGVAHEINNPTAVILGNLDILIAEIGNSRDNVQTEIDLIIQQVYRIRSITDRLLQYSRSENEFPINNFVSQNLRELIRETLEFLRHESSNPLVRFSEKYNSTRQLAIDQHEFQQVLVNLVRNSVQSLGGAGTIEIATEDVGSDEVCITVRDTGCGIAAAHLPRVFDPFFTSGKEHGTGLGLSVSYGIVRRYGGRIMVESEPGEGALFSVFLPCVETASVAVAQH